MQRKLIPYEKTGNPIYDIDLNDDPENRWSSLCEAEAENMASLMEDVAESCREYLEYIPAKLRPIVARLTKPSGSFATSVASIFGQDYVREIKGIAKCTGLPTSHIFLANLMYDICVFLDKYDSSGACSSYSCSVRGKPVLVRNMDWDDPESVGEHTRIVRFHKGKKNYTAVCILGCVGMLSAVSKGRWAITMNQAPLGNAKFGVLQWPAMHRIRNVCDDMGSFTSTVSKLREYRTMAPFYAHVVGAKPEQQVVVIARGSETVLRKPEYTSLIQTNHSIGCYEDENWKKEETDSFDRYNALERRLSKKPTTMKEALQKLARSPVTHEGTQHQMLLNPSSGTMMLKVRC